MVAEQMEESPRFGDLLRRYRRRAGLTQEELAELALVSPRGVQDLERGVTRRPRRDTILRLLEALKLDADDRIALEAAAHTPLLPVNASESRTVTSPDQRVPVGGYLSAIPLLPLVERRRELACSLAALENAAAGEGRSLMLAGEPGVGKTRLAQEVSVHAQRRGFIVAPGSCYESRQSVSYYPFLDAMGALYMAAPSSISSAIPERWPYLGRLLPDAGLPQPSALSDVHEEQERLFRAIAGFIIATSEVIPVTLLLDDLHWTDEASLSLLQHVIRHTRGSRVFLLATYRDVEVGRYHALERTLNDLHRDRLIERMTLRRLGKDGTAELIRVSLAGPSISHEFTERIYRSTDGNPFFTQEVVQTLVERGDLSLENGRWIHRVGAEIEVPDSVRSVIGQRVLRLEEDTREMLSEASVLGHTFTFHDLLAMSRQQEARVERGLQEALEAGLLQEGEGETYFFNHALTQHVLYSEFLSPKRRRLHLAAAEALATLPRERQEERASELFRHFRQGGDLERALPYAMLAGRAAERVFASSEAERHYRTALALARELDDQRREAVALERLGVVLAALVRTNPALDTLEQAATAYRVQGDLEAEGRTVAAIGQVHAHRGSAHAGMARVEPLIEAVEKRGPSPSLARLYLARAGLAMVLSKPEDMFHYADRAVDVAGTLGDPRLLTEAIGLRGGALLRLRRLDEATSALEHVIPLHEGLDDPVGMVGALYDLAYVHDARGEFDEARRCFERGLAVAQRVADPSGMCWMLEGLAWNALVAGRWDRMREYVAQMGVIMKPFHDPGMASNLLFLQIALALQEGDYEAASMHLAATTALAEQTGSAFIRNESNFLRACLDLVDGRPEAAILILQAQIDEGEPESDLTILPLLAEAYLLAGDPVQAEQVVVRALYRASVAGDRRTLTGALRVHGMLLTRRRDWSEAARILAEALALAESMQMPWEEAHIRYELGMMFAARGEYQPARERIEEAAALYLRLAARRERERMQQALAALA